MFVATFAKIIDNHREWELMTAFGVLAQLTADRKISLIACAR